MLCIILHVVFCKLIFSFNNMLEYSIQFQRLNVHFWGIYGILKIWIHIDYFCIYCPLGFLHYCTCLSNSSTLAWKIAWAEEPGGLQSMGLRGVGHDWATSLSLFTFLLWRRKWQPTPAFLPGESQGRGSLVGCCLWGRTESDTTDAA